jgi:hypothetical protein
MRSGNIDKVYACYSKITKLKYAIKVEKMEFNKIIWDKIISK